MSRLHLMVGCRFANSEETQTFIQQLCSRVAFQHLKHHRDAAIKGAPLQRPNELGADAALLKRRQQLNRFEHETVRLVGDPAEACIVIPETNHLQCHGIKVFSEVTHLPVFIPSPMSRARRVSSPRDGHREATRGPHGMLGEE